MISDKERSIKNLNTKIQCLVVTDTDLLDDLN